MSPWITKNGHHIFISSSNTDDVPNSNPRKNNPNYSSDDDKKRLRELEEYARWKNEEFKKREKQSKVQKKEALFDQVINLNLGHAKGFLIKATPTLLRLDPTLSSIYTGYQVSKYGYCFLKKVNEDYQTSGSYEESLKTVAKQEVEEKIISKVKLLALDNGSKYAANRIWAYCKDTYSHGNMDPKWDEFGEKALAKTFEEIGGRIL